MPQRLLQLSLSLAPSLPLSLPPSLIPSDSSDPLECEAVRARVSESEREGVRRCERVAVQVLLRALEADVECVTRTDPHCPSCSANSTAHPQH
eukprot:3776402-Rhodomonas_salina.2